MLHFAVPVASSGGVVLTTVPNGPAAARPHQRQGASVRVVGRISRSRTNAVSVQARGEQLRVAAGGPGRRGYNRSSTIGYSRVTLGGNTTASKHANQTWVARAQKDSDPPPMKSAEDELVEEAVSSDLVGGEAIAEDLEMADFIEKDLEIEEALEGSLEGLSDTLQGEAVTEAGSELKEALDGLPDTLQGEVVKEAGSELKEALEGSLEGLADTLQGEAVQEAGSELKDAVEAELQGFPDTLEGLRDEATETSSKLVEEVVGGDEMENMTAKLEEILGGELDETEPLAEVLEAQKKLMVENLTSMSEELDVTLPEWKEDKPVTIGEIKEAMEMLDQQEGSAKLKELLGTLQEQVATLEKVEDTLGGLVDKLGHVETEVSTEATANLMKATLAETMDDISSELELDEDTTNTLNTKLEDALKKAVEEAGKSDMSMKDTHDLMKQELTNAVTTASEEMGMDEEKALAMQTKVEVAVEGVLKEVLAEPAETMSKEPEPDEKPALELEPIEPKPELEPEPIEPKPESEPLIDWEESQRLEAAMQGLSATLESAIAKPGHSAVIDELDSMLKQMSATMDKMERPPMPAGAAVKTPAEIDTGPKIGGPVGEAVILQAFHWESCMDEGSWYAQLESQVKDMADGGITDVWLPPPSASVTAQGYLPTLLYQLDSEYGTKEELKSLIAKLHENNIRAICDVIINHRCADQQDEDGNWVVYGDDSDHAGQKINWGSWAITCDDSVFPGKGHKDSGADYAGAPDLDHENPDLRAALKNWLNWLHTDIGFDSWRFDFARGFAPQFIKEYIEETVGAGNLNVGEFWSDGGSSELGYFVKGTNSTCMAFDFPLKERLHDAINNVQYWQLGSQATGKQPGLLGCMPTKSVTFVENHDTGKPQWHWPFPQEHIMAGYAYILTHPGIPTIFYSHLYGDGSVDGPTSGELGDDIKKLATLRKKAGINHNSTTRVLMEEDDCYMALIDDKVITKMGPRFHLGDLLPDPEEYEMIVSGRDMCVWAKRDLKTETLEEPSMASPVDPTMEVPKELAMDEELKAMEDLTMTPPEALTEEPPEGRPDLPPFRPSRPTRPQ